MLRRKLLIATGALALTIPSIAYADTGVDRFDDTPTKGKIDSTFVPGYADKNSKVTVMVELTGDPVAVVEAQSGPVSNARATQIRTQLKKSQDQVKADIKDRGGKVLSQMQSAYNGMRVTLPRSQVRAVSQLEGVKSVTQAPVHTLDNTVSVPYLGVPKVWQSTGYTGKNVKVAIIDTGIDYTHADFGGPGTTEAYETAHANETTTADPDLFGPTSARVKGGWDFVGDSYNADSSSDSYQPVAHPDANPLDCQGHGSHVAGTTAGSGVNADGTTYTGPYDTSTTSTSFKVGPGVAPEADLYALRVFGCDGSTDVVTEAIDWAVKHKMQVINMSLGSSFGKASDSDAIAAQNAQAAGVVVVASAGNSGPNPYISGSPGVAKGIINVAAVDSTALFSGAVLSFNGTTLDAINANGADPLPTGPFTIVNTNSLGCDTASFTAAGITPGGNQIAIVTRGTCARVAKAIFGQQAGAAAVIMVNSDTSYPPYEGAITSNPDDSTAYTVTIPFLGVPSTDGPALIAAAGKSVTLAAKSLTNPGFNDYGSFSSGGPRNGDSGLKPSISAPGVSISSVAVGTGTEAEVMSGTSMAAPHVAGVAALARQAHKKWTANQISSALVSTADYKKLAAYRLTLGGGLVDAKQAVDTSVFAIGDQYKVTGGTVSEATLSYGFAESSTSFSGVKKLTLVNKGSKRAIFVLSNAKTSQSVAASITFSKKVVVVPAKSSRTVRVKLKAKASKVGSSLGDDQFGFKEVSGNIKIATNGKGTLYVPYLLVPRASATVAAKQTVTVSPGLTTGVTIDGGGTNQTKSASPSPTQSTNSPSASPSATQSTTSPTPGKANVKLTNPKGALPALADFYTWGLKDPKDVSSGTGFDLRAAGAQSIDTGDDQLLVFAVNNWTRWSTAATQEFDVLIDVDQDGTFDWAVFSFDSGAIRDESADGLTEVFLYKIATGDLYASGFLAQAPTDSSTILLPAYASDLGITGAFDYSVVSYDATGTDSDEFDSVASYDPFNKAISNGDTVTVPVNGTKTVGLTFDPTQLATQDPLGTMVVVVDNKSGKNEALLLPAP
ncbi:S8 family serine peptidase [Micropruina sp.]|uniref:S8 family peptidase n=1 Tax=Micropruina sp. TaxID=2737536 RepID=UPI0039E5DEF6